MTTLTTLAPTIDANGISAPTFADIYAWLQAKFQSIYGADVYIDPDSQDGQFLAVIAQGFSDVNSASIAIYNSFSPSKGVGAALSSNVKINGIKRESASYSSADLTLVGQAGTTITNGIAKDANENQWALPASVTIPPAGQVTVTATCTTIGAIAAAIGTITTIGTPTRGWQSVTNATAAAEGAPIETDPALRARQKRSTALPSLAVLDGIIGAVSDLSGVTQCVGYENDTGVPDGNGIPRNSISLVVEGGDVTAIASVIAIKKTPGAGTYGTTTETVPDNYGRPVPISFFRPTDAPITVAVVLKVLAGYTDATGSDVKDAIAAYVNGTDIGGGLSGNVEWDSCVAEAKSVTGGSTFRIVSLVVTGPRGAGAPDVALLFNEKASCTADAVTVTPT